MSALASKGRRWLGRVGTALGSALNLRLVLAACAGGVAAFTFYLFLGNAAREGGNPAPAAGERELNEHILREIETIERQWQVQMMSSEKVMKSVGVIRDVSVGSARVVQGSGNGESHCIGLVFDVWIHAFQGARTSAGQPADIGTGSVADFWRLQRAFFGADGNRKTFANALPVHGLGRIVALQEAKKGDLVQFWRENGSGHSGIFIDHLKHATRGIVGLKLWSVTTGRGASIENYSFLNGEMIPGETYIVRTTY